MLPDEARRHVYLLVKGLLGDEMFRYLDDNRLRLERRGPETREVQVDTQGSLADNLEGCARHWRTRPSSGARWCWWGTARAPVAGGPERYGLAMDHAEAALVSLPGFAHQQPGNLTEAMVALALDA